MIDHPGVCAIFWQDGWFFVLSFVLSGVYAIFCSIKMVAKDFQLHCVHKLLTVIEDIIALWQ